MSEPKIKVTLEGGDEELQEGGKPLFSLCRKEAETFSSFLVSTAHENDPTADGLTDWELDAVGSYLYQKLRERF